MKTKILGGIALLAIAAAMAFNVSLNTDKNNQMSALALANVEALAAVEAGSVLDCYTNTHKEEGSYTVPCATCVDTANRSSDWWCWADECTPAH